MPFQGDREFTSRKLRNNKHGSLTDLSTSSDSQMSAIQESLKTITGKLDGISVLQSSITDIMKDFICDEDGMDERIKNVGQ